MRETFAVVFSSLTLLSGCGGGRFAVRPAPTEPAIPSPIARDHNAPFEERVRTIYNFKPARISAKDQELKSAEMDALWETVDKDPTTYLPRLREELVRTEQNAFFRYDGAMLLWKHSKAAPDLQLAADSLGRSDLEDIRTLEYFRSTHGLAAQGANVWPCVNKILSEKDFKVFIPQHSLTLDRKSVAIYCFLLMNEELYVAPLRARLKEEKELDVVKSILAGLSVAVTEEAQTVLRDFARNSPNASFRRLAEPLSRLPSKKDLPGRAEGNRELFFAFLGDLTDRRLDNPAYSFETFKKGAAHLVRKADLPSIRELRRAHASRVSDEAIEELEYLTYLMKVALGSED